VTPQQAGAYAEKVLAAIEQSCDGTLEDVSHVLHDLVLSALRALHRAQEGLEQHAVAPWWDPDFMGSDPAPCGFCTYDDRRVQWPCPDARRYAEARDDALDDLRRVGQLYAVSETNAPDSPERATGAIGERTSTEQADQ
jgi:hypothetical protein